jgi:hypothetical protein
MNASPASLRRRELAVAALPVLAVMALWAALHIGFFYSAVGPVLDGALIDTDSHMKLVRIERLLATGAWFDGSVPRSNAPFGETLHWTRLFDIVLVALAAPLRLVVETKAALHLAGAAISPLLHLGLGFALLWALRPLARRYGAAATIVAVLLTLVQMGIAGYALAGRADHHVLLMLLFALAFGCFLRMATAPFDAAAPRGPAPELLAGAFMALGVWGSVELLPAAAAGAAAGGLAWILHGGDFERINRRFALAFAGGAALALMLERPPAEYFVAEYDRLSIAQVAAAAAVAATWLLIGAVRRWLPLAATRRHRLIAAAIAAGAAGLALVVLFPKLLAGPSAAFDPAIRAIWLERVGEMHPLWPNSAARLAKLLTFCGTVLIALPVVAWKLARCRGAAERTLWLCLAVGLATVFPVAIAHVRYSAYAEILAAPATIVIVRGVLVWSEGLSAALLRVAIRVGTIGGLFLAPIGAATALQPPGSPQRDAAGLQAACALRAVTPALIDPSGPLGGRPHTILSHIDLGPEILYRTPHRVVGTPYHRNHAGIVDTVAALGGPPDAARAIVAARKVDAILICRRAPDASYFAKAGSGSLQEKLAAGDAPDWLVPAALPAEAAARFALYMVKRP